MVHPSNKYESKLADKRSKTETKLWYICGASATFASGRAFKRILHNAKRRDLHAAANSDPDGPLRITSGARYYSSYTSSATMDWTGPRERRARRLLAARSCGRDSPSGFPAKNSWKE